MSPRQDRRRAALDQIADHVLRAGLEQTSLRTLAAAAGMSDRMLLYYFADKNEVVAETLRVVAMRLAGLLNQAIPATKREPFAALLADVWAALRAPLLQPFMHVWLEIAARAAREEEPYRAIGGLMADGFLAWVSARLVVEQEADRVPQAALLIATVDGLALLNAVGRGAAADRALDARPARIRNKAG